MGGVAARLRRLEKHAGGVGNRCPECRGLGPQNRFTVHFDYEPEPPPPVCEVCGRVGEYLVRKVIQVGADFDRRAFAPREAEPAPQEPS